MSASLIVSIFLQLVLDFDTKDAHNFSVVMLVTVLISTIVWLTVTFITRPEKDETLLKFYKKIHPGGRLWKPIADKAPDVIQDEGFIRNILDWAAGVLLIYSVLFSIGKFVFGDWLLASGMLLIAILLGIFLIWDLTKRGWKSIH